jgi:UDP-3-O-[3-hydroxymyristoyl] glucosamine N-acyltransferase
MRQGASEPVGLEGEGRMAEPVFFAPARSVSVAEIAELTAAKLVDPAHGSRLVARMASAAEADDSTLVFIEGRRNASLMKGLSAAAVLCTEDLARLVPANVATLITPRPQWAFALVGRLIYPTAARPQPLTGETGISSRAFIARTANLETGVIVEAGAVIGPDAAVGSGTVVAANAVIGTASQIGRDCFIGPCATIQAALIGNRVVIHGGAQIGREGFGFAAGPRGAERLPQIGRVVIQDDVEIGANTAVDRGGLADTVIGEGTKIDNLVQIGHNCRIGRGCLIAGKVGLSGSVTLGDFVQIGGGSGIADHLTVGSGAKLAAQSGLMHDIPPGETWGGTPAAPFGEKMREIAIIRRLVKNAKGGRLGD